MRKKYGFTLLETVMYLGILSFLMGAGVTAAFYIIESGSKNKTDVNTQAEGNFIVRKIEWALTGASSVTILSPTSISVTKDTSTGFPASQNPLVFSLNGSNVQLTRGNPVVSTANLNSSNVTIAPVSGVIFAATGATPAGISVSFILSSGNPVKSQTFTVTKYLRK